MNRKISLSRTWTLGRQLGRGGFGAVYLATDDAGSVAALKLVEKRPGGDREMLMAGEVSGLPKVVPIIDSGENGNDYVLVMPLADRSLREQLDAAAPLPTDSAVPILSDVAEALAAVHAKGVVHRDVKPENVLLVATSWEISDFGIARYAEATTGMFTFKDRGTAEYAAPERWRGERAGRPSDVYSFGIMAYELLAGRQPFSGEDVGRQHVNDAPPSLAGVPPRLASLVLECLDKSPEFRPAATDILRLLPQVLAPATPGAAALHAANRAVIAERAETEAKNITVQSEQERRLAITSSASKRLDAVMQTLRGHIVEAAPAAQDSTIRTATTGWAISLGPATLSVDTTRPVPRRIASAPFDVVAYSAIRLRIPATRVGWEGRSHSLWFCDAKEEGVYRWYETAFMTSPLIPARGSVEPFALTPDQGEGPLHPVLGETQAAWPFLPFDQGDEADFIDRWLEWFGLAAQGHLNMPMSMPERADAHHSWRR